MHSLVPHKQLPLCFQLLGQLPQACLPEVQVVLQGCYGLLGLCLQGGQLAVELACHLRGKPKLGL